MKKKANTLLGQSVETFVKDSHLCIYCLDINTKKIIYANPAFYELLGYSEKEIETLDVYQIINHSKESVDAIIDDVIKTKHRNTSEREWKRKDGKVIHMFVNASYGEKNSGMIYISAQDISKRKRIERELQKSEHFLNESQRVSKIGSFVIDIKKGTWKGSAELKRIFGISNSYSSSIESWLSLIHPAYQKAIKEYFEKDVIKKKKRFDKEYKIINQKTKQEICVHGIGELEFDHNGLPVKMIGTVQDICLRKKAETEIIETENKFRSVVKSAKDSIVLANEKGEIVFWNLFAVKIFGYNENEVIGKPLSFILPERFREIQEHSFDNCLLNKDKTEKDTTLALYGLKKSGLEFPIELSLSHWTNENKTFFCGIIRDITERKNAEEKQRKHFKKLSEIAFLQSHQVRAPIAAILGLIDLINFNDLKDKENIKVFHHLKKTTQMCDDVIKEIIKKTSEIEELNKQF